MVALEKTVSVCLSELRSEEGESSRSCKQAVYDLGKEFGFYPGSNMKA